MRSISGSVTGLLSLTISSFALRQYSRGYRGFMTLRPRAPSHCEYVIRSVVGHTIVRSLTISRSSFLWEVSRRVTWPILIVDKSFLSRRRGDGNLDHLVKPVL